MKQTIILLSIVLGLAVFLAAQTHTFPALDTANTFTALNTFNAGITSAGPNSLNGTTTITNSMLNLGPAFSSTSQVNLPDGTATNPSLRFVSQSNSGIDFNSSGFSPGPTLVDAGQEVLAWNPGGASTTAPMVPTAGAYGWIASGNYSGGKFTGTTQDTGISRPSAGVVQADTTTIGNGLGSYQAAAYKTTANCAVNSVSPAACGAASAGAFVIPTTTTTYTVNTTAVTAASRIFLFPMSFAGNLPSSPTCVVPAITAEPTVSAISAGVSFTMTEASTTGQTCWQYLIVN